MSNGIEKNLETDITSPTHVATHKAEMDVPESVGDNADQAEKEMEVDLNIRIAEARRKAAEYDRMHAQQKAQANQNSETESAQDLDN